jgi:hypothetical protein
MTLDELVTIKLALQLPNKEEYYKQAMEIINRDIRIKQMDPRK